MFPQWVFELGVGLLLLGLSAFGWFYQRNAKKADQADEERHQAVLASLDAVDSSVREHRELMMKKLEAYCDQQEKIHRQIDERFWRHWHDEETGDIIIRSDGKAL